MGEPMPSDPRSPAFSMYCVPGEPPVMIGGTSMPANCRAFFVDAPASKPM